MQDIHTINPDREFLLVCFFVYKPNENLSVLCYHPQMEAINGSGMRAPVCTTLSTITGKISGSHGITGYFLVTLVERGRIRCFKHYCAVRGQMKGNARKVVKRRTDFYYYYYYYYYYYRRHHYHHLLYAGYSHLYT
jgi:hypothetical protein